LKYLLDASALLPLVTGHGKQLISEASRETLTTTDLAMYEACNSLWKLAKLLRSISLEDALVVAMTLKDLVARNLIQSIGFTSLDLSQTLRKAYEEQLTFYDASYIAITESTGSILVTEDEELRKAASKSVQTITYSDFDKQK